MKKFLHVFGLAAFLLVSSCSSDNISRLGSGITSVAKCCQGLSSAGCSSDNNFVTEVKEKSLQAVQDDSAFLPYYSWDTKMLIW